MNRLQYKGYTGEYQIDLENGEIVGKLENIRDLVTFCTREISSLEAVFREAVDDYLADCEEIGRQPDKPFKGVFNVRIKPELHRELAAAARVRNRTLNDYVSIVLGCHKHVELAERFEASESTNFIVVRTVTRGGKPVPNLGTRTSAGPAAATQEPQIQSDVQRWDATSIVRH
ncbi:MAG: toxin-antitoxin system HicB family antitoxin [Nioella sp.]|nr:toxin-antitoxin system HicB family antitoxin [Nioella sp.]